MLVGSLVAIVTPMFEDGSIDYDSLGHLIDWHIDCGTRGIVVVGTTGESPTVNVDEHADLIEYCSETRIQSEYQSLPAQALIQLLKLSIYHSMPRRSGRI